MRIQQNKHLILYLSLPILQKNSVCKNRQYADIVFNNNAVRMQNLNVRNKLYFSFEQYMITFALKKTLKFILMQF